MARVQFHGVTQAQGTCVVPFKNAVLVAGKREACIRQTFNQGRPSVVADCLPARIHNRAIARRTADH